jgi:hypothetical protein
MKFAIITFYNSNNQGAYLQALALQTVLKEKGECYFLRIKGRSLFLRSLHHIQKALFSGQLNRVIFEFKRFHMFLNNGHKFHTIRKSKLSVEFILVFGSDEIWNISSENNWKRLILWGVGLESYKMFSYAPTVNNATIKDYYEHKELQGSLKKFSKISVRDEHSKSVIESFTGKPVRITLDPTLLLPKTYWIENSEKIDYLQDYIAVYCYANQISENRKQVIINIAKCLGKKLVSLCSYLSWCDLNVVSRNVFDYYINADYVVTSTFHGTLFAVNLEKQFIVFSENNKKVSEFLESFGLIERNLPRAESTEVLATLQKRVDWSHVGTLLEKKRIDSLNFINEAIKELSNAQCL